MGAASTHGDPLDTPALLQAGVAALREQRFDEAVEKLETVWKDEAFATSEDLADIRARVGSLLAQAHLERGDARAADRPCREAIRILRRLRDKPGLDAVRELQDRIVRSLAHDAEAASRLAEQRRVATTPIEELLEGVEGEERLAALVRKATAHIDLDEHDVGAILAQQGLDEAREASHATWQVMALLALARATPQRAVAHLVAARDIADSHSEFNLISTVARAAQVAEVELPALPIAGRSKEC